MSDARLRVEGLAINFETAEPDCSSGQTHLADTRGEYVLFMEGSDYLKPDAVAAFVKVASHTGADVLTCFVALFTGGTRARLKRLASATVHFLATQFFPACFAIILV